MPLLNPTAFCSPRSAPLAQRARAAFVAAVAVCLVSIAGLSCAQTLASKIDYLGTPWYLTISNLASRERDGLLQLNVEFSNAGPNDEEGFYRVTWLDGDGFPAWSEEAWKPVLLHGQQRQPVLIVAPTPKARDFKIQFSAQSNAAMSGPRN